MTTIVDALNRIARQCSLKAPSSWVNATRDDHVELRDDFLGETVDDILDRVDLPGPIGASSTLAALHTATASTLNSDGSRTYALPSDFKRLHRDSHAIYDVEQDTPALPISTDGQFQYLTDTGAAGSIHYYQLKGYDGNFSLTLYDDPGTGNPMIVNYSTTYWMATSAGTVGDMFTSEDDVLLLPRRLVESGTVWRYRERRGLPYQDKYQEYEGLFSRMINDKRGRRVINMGEPEAVRWTDLVPAFIPPS